MADNLPNITITPGVWIDLYKTANISVGAAIAVENIGVCDVRLTVTQDQPDVEFDAYNLVERNGDPMRNSEGDSGAWAFCHHQTGKLSVRPL